MSIFDTLKFTQEWLDLQIITPDKLEKLEEEWQAGEDQNDEHYRWRVFREFMESNELLDPAVLRRIYKLGERDADPMMGGAMMVDVLNRKECPVDLLESAAGSEEKFLRRVANRKLEKRSIDSQSNDI